MATLNVENKVVAFGDVAITNNPRQKYADWTRTIQGVEISEPITKSKSAVAAGNTLDIAGTDTQAGTISGISYGIQVDSYDSTFTRTKLFGDFGHEVVVITSLDSIIAHNGGVVQFVVSNALQAAPVSRGDVFWVKGASTDDEDITGPIQPLNMGLWRVVKVVGSSLYCQKVDGCSGAMNQTDIGPLGGQALVVCNQLSASLGNYVSLIPENQQPFRPQLFKVIYSDCSRIDVGPIPFSLPTSPFNATVCQDRFTFAYIETDGEALVTVQVGGVNPDYQIPVVPIQQPSGELVGIFQLTSEFNFISVANIDSKDIKVSAIVGG